jgi:beta-glucosidase
MNAVHIGYPDKSLHVTECSSSASSSFAESLMWTTRVLVVGSMRNWAESVVTWNLALDEQFGPHLGGCVDCIGLVTINRGTGAVTFNAAFFALAHVSKFVQRGAYRIASTTQAAQGVDNVTFRNPDGSYVLIVSNESARAIKVRNGSESFSYALPAGSVATFRWPGGALPAPVPVPAATVPGLIEAENFDQGGEGRAYHDLTAINSGAVYRNEAVDIQATTDVGGGYNVGWMAAGEWLEYSVDVTKAGAYAMDARVASSGAGGTFHVEVNGVDKTGPIVIPDTYGWQAWTTVTRVMTPLAAGVQRLRIVVDANGANGDAGNLNYIRLTAAATTAPASTPFNGTPAPIPGVIEAENFDNAGEGLGYHDLGPGNTGGQYRATDVDIEASTDTGNGYNVGWISAGEWLKFTVNVAATGAYTLDVRVAANGAGGTFHVEANQVDVTGPLTIPNTGGWQTWRTITKTGVNLTAGVQVLRVVLDTAGATGVFGNLNYLRWTSAVVTAPPPAIATNLALGRLASSSSSENGSYAPSLAVDGSATTRWSSAFSDPQWIAVDLGASAAITRVVLRWEVAYGADYLIQTSNDKTTWTTVGTVTRGDGGVDDLTGLVASGRYVRVYGTGRGTPWGYSLWEFEVWGTFPVTTP